MKSWIAGKEYTLKEPVFCPGNRETLKPLKIQQKKEPVKVEMVSRNTMDMKWSGCQDQI